MPRRPTLPPPPPSRVSARALLNMLGQFAVPATLLLTASVLVSYRDRLPASLSGLELYGPYLLFLVGAALALAFNRGRALLALVVIAGAYAFQQAWLEDTFPPDQGLLVRGALAVLVPLNLAALSAVPERGAFNRHSAVQLAALGSQALLVAWSTSASPTTADWLTQRLLGSPPLDPGHMPQASMVTISLSLLLSVAATLITRAATHAALAGAIVAFALGTMVPPMAVTGSYFSSTALLMVTVAVLQDTFRMAFRDELTGLPSRRALNERLVSLGRQYTVAMVDVDHFKKFNDTYGHETGDQVLKMVAARIANVGGGGRPFRYGGEEFTILFPGRTIREALPHLEALRGRIEAYRFVPRAEDRPRKTKRQRGNGRAGSGVSVTVSLGVAECNERFPSPQAVIEAADRALYRAKKKGRNQVSR